MCMKFLKILLCIFPALFLAACFGGIEAIGDNGGNGGGNGSTTITATMSLVRLDGTPLQFDDSPIPRMVSVTVVLSEAVEAAGDQAIVQSAFSLVDEDGTQVSGTFNWSADGTSFTFTSTTPLRYQTTYTASVAETEITASVSKATVQAASSSMLTLLKGDINGDGLSDIIMGSDSTWSGVKVGNGAAYIFFGESIVDCQLGVDCSPATTILGAATGDTLGTSVAIAGDINADGYEDVVIGAPNSDAGGGFAADRGEAYIFLGSAAGISDCDIETCTPTATIRGVADFNRLGSSVAGAGDIDGDGYGDVLIGVPTGAGAVGQALLFYGRTLAGSLSANDADEVVQGAVLSDNVGFSVAGAGDINADGYDDLLVGAPATIGMTGRSLFYLGAADGIGCASGESCTPSVELTGSAADDFFGSSVAGVGDVNGDGFGDMLVGARNASDGIDRPGRAYLFLGSANAISDCDVGTGCADAMITGETNGDFLGVSVSGGGDVNGDGFDDIIAGARNARFGGNIVGAAYVFHGGGGGIADCDLGAGCTADTTVTGPSIPSTLGISIDIANDVNGDGISDLMVGASNADVGGAVNAGSTFFFLGSDGVGITDCDLSVACTADMRIDGGVATDDLGISVSGR